MRTAKASFVPGLIGCIAPAIIVAAAVGGTPKNVVRPPVAGRDIGLVPRQHPDWTRPPVQMPVALAGAALPEYYIYEGAAVVMPVDGTRLALRDAGALGLDTWTIVPLEPGVADAAAVAARIEIEAARPGVGFVSPVFSHPSIKGGWLAVTSDVIARVQPRLLGTADAILAGAAPDLAIIERDFAGLPGAFRLRSASASGFTTLAAANRLALDPRFAWAEPELIGTMDLSLVPNDPQFAMCWGLNNTGQQGCCADVDLDAPESWDITVGALSMRVLVLDTGVEQDHPDINQAPGRDFTNGLPNGGGTGDPIDDCDNHGTCVAGIISAIMNNNLGTVGIAPNCRSVSARIAQQQSNPCSSDWAFYSQTWIANAINWGYNQGIQVTNASFDVAVSQVITDAYDDTWFNGMMHFAATGNDSDNNLNFPALLGSVHAVTSIDPDGVISSFANFGPGSDFSAPGTLVWTTDRTGADGYTANGDYVYFEGTSAASPFAAGAAALVWSALPEYSSTVIEFWLQQGATDLGVPGYDTVYGYGLVNPRASLDGPGPSNNFCANAIPILTPVYQPAPFDTTIATAFTGEPQDWCEDAGAGVSNSVWFAFFSPCDGVIDVNTNGSNYDTVLSAWVGACSFALPVACDDDSGAGSSSQLLDVPVSGGYLYMIKVSDYNTAPGGGMLDFNFAFQQPNDNCLGAIDVGTGSTPFCTLGATESVNEPACFTLFKDVWFTHTATQDGQLRVSTCGSSGYDTRLAVYEEGNGSTCPAPFGAQLLACNDNAPGGCNAGASALTVAVEQGTTYTIRVGGPNAPAGSGSLTLTYVTCTGDVNGDGVVNVIDLLALLAAWGTNDPNADVTGDGTVNVTDMLALLAAWGACP